MTIPDDDWTRILAIMRQFKATNPKFLYDGREQDPLGVHALVEKYERWVPPVKVEVDRWSMGI